VHIAASQSVILAGESTEVDNLAKRATLVKGQSGGAVVLSAENDAVEGSSLSSGDRTAGSIINYELWVQTSPGASKGRGGPIDLYKRTFQGAALSRIKILDVFA
jgi:hypothetical protein